MTNENARKSPSILRIAACGSAYALAIALLLAAAAMILVAALVNAR